MTTPRAIELHIEELVLDGAVSGDRQLIARSIERELGRLLAEPGIPPALTVSETLPLLDGGRFDVAPDARPRAIGQQVARAVYRGLSR